MLNLMRRMLTTATFSSQRAVITSLLVIVALNSPSDAQATECIGPNSAGTTVLPTGCGLETRDGPMLITDGLLAGDTIEIELVELSLACVQIAECSAAIPPFVCEGPGGIFGGQVQCYSSTFELTITGTGTLSGFSRVLNIPMITETNSVARVPGDPIQAFDHEFVFLNGELFGDPDFCTLEFRAGHDFGLTNLGKTALTELPDTNFEVDSFFDIDYQIEFVGCPGSILEGRFGTTNESAWISVGEPVPEPGVMLQLSASAVLLVYLARRRSR